MSVYGYVRVSTIKQADAGDSLEAQRRMLQGYAQMKGLVLDHVFVEEGVSGSIPVNKRPMGGALLDQLMPGDALVAAKLDRLFRSALDALQTVEDLNKRGVSLHLLDLGGDVANSGMAKLFLTVAAAFAEAERDRIRERVASTVRDLRSQGKWCGPAPFGWKMVKSPDGKGFILAEDTEAMTALRTVAAPMRDTGRSMVRISEAMRRQGFTISRRGVKVALERLDSGFAGRAN